MNKDRKEALTRLGESISTMKACFEKMDEVATQCQIAISDFKDAVDELDDGPLVDQLRAHYNLPHFTDECILEATDGTLGRKAIEISNEVAKTLKDAIK